MGAKCLWVICYRSCNIERESSWDGAETCCEVWSGVQGSLWKMKILMNRIRSEWARGKTRAGLFGDKHSQRAEVDMVRKCGLRRETE